MKQHEPCIKRPSEQTRARKDREAADDETTRLNAALRTQPCSLSFLTLWGQEEGRVLAISRFWEARVLFGTKSLTLFLDEATRLQLFAALKLERHPWTARKETHDAQRTMQ